MNHYSSNWPSETAKIMNREISNNFNPINMLQIPILTTPKTPKPHPNLPLLAQQA